MKTNIFFKVKGIARVFSYLLLLTSYLFISCTPDSDSMGAIDLTAAQLAENTGFSVNVDQTTNQVTFTSLLPSSYSVYWEYGPAPTSDDVSISGTSTNSTYQVGVAFDGDYYVRMGVQTRGGIVFSDRASFHINQMNPNLISDAAWTMLHSRLLPMVSM